ncbi:MAG: glycosyltransferase family 2 protein [Flavobacteriales bacterium]|nr:glycosyltransferase family 2 protein [Flavobacteriales bacterium]
MSKHVDPRPLAVIVTYNGMLWIERCLASVLESIGAVDIVVVDNGSTDGTQDRIRTAFPEVELIQAEENLGFGQANNIGLRKALHSDAPYVLLLNQDAWLTPGSLERLIHMSEQHPQFGILSPMHLNGAGDRLDERFAEYIVPFKCPDLYSDLVLGKVRPDPYPVSFVNAAGWLITRKCLRTVGGFNPNFFHYGEDSNYIHRLQYHGLRTGIVPSAWMHHDRSERQANPYFDDPVLLRARQLKIAFADPNMDRSLTGELAAFKRKVRKFVFSLQRTEARIAMAEWKELHDAVAPQLIRDRERSKQPGETFL